MCNQTKTTGKTSESTDFWYDPNGNQISSMTVLTGGADSSGIPTVTASTTVGISLQRQCRMAKQQVILITVMDFA